MVRRNAERLLTSRFGASTTHESMSILEEELHKLVLSSSSEESSSEMYEGTSVSL